MCSIEDRIYLVDGDRRVKEYNSRTRTWRNMPSLEHRRTLFSVCTLDNKIFVLGGGSVTCEVLDLDEDDPHWRYISSMSCGYQGGGAVDMEGNIYALGGGYEANNVEVYDIDQGMSLKYLQS